MAKSLKKNTTILIYNTLKNNLGNIHFLLVLLISLGFNLNLFSQTIAEVEELQKKYKGNNVVNILNSSHIRIYFNKEGGISFENTPTLKRLYLNDNASSNSSSAISYSTNFELLKLEASTLIPTDKKFDVEKVEKFAKKKEFRPGVFHDGSISVNFFYPSLTKGAISFLTYTVKTDIPQFLNPFYIEDYYPTVKREITIEADNGIDLAYLVYNAKASDYPPEVIEGKKTTTYKWVIEDIKPYEYDNNAPSLSYYTPLIIPRINSYTIKGKKTNVLSNLDDFYKWCYSFVDSTDKEPSDEIKTITDSLVANAENDLDKIRNIYYWVQDNVKYVAFEEGMQGFIPENAAAVCQKRYGDCKGMTSLLYTMLRYAGIEAYFTWIGTREMPYSQKEVPTPISQDHMILTYKYNGEFYFMDGTSEFSPAGEPSAFIMGKEALVGIDKENYKLIEVSPTSADYSTYCDSITIRLNADSTITGIAKSTLTGFYKSSWLGLIKKRTEKEIKEIMDDFLQRGNNKFKLDTFILSTTTERDKPFEINYEFTIRDYANINDSLAFINLNLNTIYMNKTMNKDRKTPYSLRYKSTNSMVVVMEIPDGYKVDYLPEASNYEDELFNFSYDIKEENGKIVQRFKQQDHFILLNKEHFSEWNEMIKKLSQAQRKSISLIKK